MPDYFLETLGGEKAIELGSAEDGAALETSELLGPIQLEVADGPVLPPWQIGGTDPTANPAVLVWFDTQGAA